MAGSHPVRGERTWRPRNADPHEVAWRVSRAVGCGRTSSSTATPRTRSSTAPRCPRSWPRGRPSSATGARAHRPRRRLRLARVRPRGEGVRRPADHRRRGDARRRLARHAPRREPSAATRTSAACSPRRTRTRAPGRESRAAAAGARPGLLEELNEGLVCLSGCARHGLAVRDPNAAPALAAAFGRDRFYVELQRPYERGDARRNAALRDLAEALGVPRSRPATSTPTTAPRARLQDVLVAIRSRTSLDGCEPERRGNHESVLLAPAEMAERFPTTATPSARTVELAERLEFDLTQELGYRYPDFSDGAEPAIVQLRRVCDRAFEERYRQRNGSASAGRAAPRRGARADRRARARRLLPPPLGGARARARGRLRGARGPARRATSCRPAAAGELGRLDRLLPDRPLARRPGRAPTCRSGASSTASSIRSRTSTSTSRATSARS